MAHHLVRPGIWTGFICVFVFIFGAIEAVPAQGAEFVVSKIADTNDGVCDADCSLREAITAANAAAGADTITFDPAVFNPGTITLTSDMPQITQNLAISGAGNADRIKIDGAGLYRAFSVPEGVTATFTRITVENNYINGNGGAIAVSGTVVLNFVAMRGNTAITGGGAVHVFTGGTLNVNNSTLWENTGFGGAISIETSAQAVVWSSTFTQNHSLSEGGAIFNNGSL